MKQIAAAVWDPTVQVPRSAADETSYVVKDALFQAFLKNH
jgi:hypothetical protein